MKHLLNLDLLKIKPSISLNNTTGYKTYLGVSLSMFIFFITIYSIRDSFEIYFDKIHPITSLSYMSNNENINITYNTLPLLISFSKYNLNTQKHDFVDIDTFNITPIVFQGKFSNEIYVKNEKYKMRRCNTTEINMYLTNLTNSDMKKYENEKDFWNLYIKQAKNSYCFEQNTSQLSIFTKDSQTYDNIMLGLHTNLSSSLYSLVIKYPKYYFTPDNKYQQYIMDMETLSFSFPSEKTVFLYSLFFNTIQIISDFSEYFVTNIKKISYIQFEKTSIYNSGLLDAETYKSLPLNMILQINQTSKSVVFNYKYQGLGYLIAYIGGAFQVYTLIISVIYKGIVLFSYKAYLLNLVFSFHFNTEKSEKQESPLKNKENQYKNLKTFSQIEKIEKIEGQSFDLNLKKEKVHEKLRLFLDNKDKYCVSSKDVFSGYLNLLLKRKGDVKERILMKYIDLLNSQYDYSNIVKNSLEAYIHKKIIVDSALFKFLLFPSVNLSNPKGSISFVERIIQSKNDEIQFEDVKNLLEKDLRKEKYVKLFEMFMGKY